MMELSMENRKWFRKRDLLLILLIGAAAVVLLLWPKEPGATALISQNGRELYAIDLTRVEEPYDISIDGEYPLVVHVEKGAVSVQEASCPDQICVRTGTLSQSGQSAVCLPAKVTIQITGDQREIDAYTGF